MKTRFILVILALLLLVGIVAGIKTLQLRSMIAAGKNFVPPPETVTSTAVREEEWETVFAAVGSLEAVQGVMVSAETPGRVSHVSFESGSMVKAGEVLLQQDVAIEKAQLNVAESRLRLARVNFDRAAQLVQSKGVARADYDNAEAQLRQAEAELDNIRAVIARKSVRAPFAGRLGIRLVNLGQNLKEGEAIVSLQVLQPVLVNFSLPQQFLPRIAAGLTVRVTNDGLPGQIFHGEITVINPEVDITTRNVRVQALLENPGEQLRPGMYVAVQVVSSGRETVLAIPLTAVLHAPYGDAVFVLEESSDVKGGPGLAVRQQVVNLGGRRGDFVAILSGLKPGEQVVSTGVFKLRNGQRVVVDNSLAPTFEERPAVSDS